MKRAHRIGFIILIMVLVSIFIVKETQYNNVSVIDFGQQLSIKADPFVINGNIALSNNATSGNGSAGNPYVIENYIIDASGFGTNGLSIENTDVYFILRNCTITNAGSNMAGINLKNVTNAKIINNTVKSNSRGIFLDYSYNNTLTNNTATNNNFGIYLYYSDYNNLTLNAVNLNSGSEGILIHQSDYNNLINNTAKDNYWGIYLMGSVNNVLINNSANDNSFGFHLEESNYNNFTHNTANDNLYSGVYLHFYGSGCHNNRLTNNTLIRNGNYGIRIEESHDNVATHNEIEGSRYGIRIEDSTNNQLNNNTIHGKGMIMLGTTISHFIQTITVDNMIDDRPIYYYKHQSNETIPTDAGQIVLVNCSLMKVQNCQLASGTVDVSLFYSNNNTLINNTAENNNYCGFFVKYSSNNTFTNNSVNNNNRGISLDESHNNTLTDNNVNDNDGFGIKLIGSYDNTLINNTANGHNSYGVHLQGSINNTLSNNTASNNGDYGFYLENSDNNTLMNNVGDNNGDHGIYLYQSTNNRIYQNYFDIPIGFSGTINDHFIQDITPDNLINGKPIYYYRHQSGGAISADAGQIVLANCSLINVTNCVLSSGSAWISLFYSNNNTISDNVGYGIHLSQAKYNTLARNSADTNEKYGIYLEDSHNNTLRDNDANTNTEQGIFLEDSTNNTLVYNVANDNTEYGIYLKNSNNNNLTQNTANSNDLYGIYLKSSNTNNLSLNTANTNGEYGIYLSSANDNTLMNNTANYNVGPNPFTQQNSGFRLETSQNNLLVNNTANYNYRGIVIASSSFNSLINNIANDNIISLGSCYGIYVLYANNNTIANNTVNRNLRGIMLQGADYNTIANNTISNNKYDGIFFFAAEYNEIYSNNFHGYSIGFSGASIAHFSQIITPDNLLDGTPIYYYKHQNSGTVPTDAGQIILVNCSLMTVQDCQLTGGSIGVSLFYSDNNTLFNITSNGNLLHGLYLEHSNNNTLTYNTANTNERSGISLEDSENNTLSHNTMTHNVMYGIEIYGLSTNNTLTNNTINQNIDGIHLRASNNTIVNNTINANQGYGIYLYDAHYNLITGNTLHDNRQCVYESANCIGNIIQDNDCQDRTLPWLLIILIIAISAAVVSVFTFMRGKKQGTASAVKAKSTWITSALGYSPELEHKIVGLDEKPQKLTSIQDPSLIQFFQHPFTYLSSEIVTQLDQMPIPESEKIEVLHELLILPLEQRQELIDELLENQGGAES